MDPYQIVGDKPNPVTHTYTEFIKINARWLIHKANYHPYMSYYSLDMVKYQIWISEPSHQRKLSLQDTAIRTGSSRLSK